MYNSQERNHEIPTKTVPQLKLLNRLDRVLGSPMYDGTINVVDVLDVMSCSIIEDQQVLALDMALKVTPTCWWATHEEDLTIWDVV